MADHTDIDFTYSLTDHAFRLSLGELADFSGAKYAGDFSPSLRGGSAAQARVRAHRAA
jgi:cyclopropane-fatty-acyl-phospholipid synthase